MDEPTAADHYLRIANSLIGRGIPTEWHRYVKHVMPSLIPASILASHNDRSSETRICARAKTDLLKLVSAHATYITPRGVNWFTFDAGKNENSRDWLNAASQITLTELEKSNFHTELLAMLIDRIATGTGLMLAENGDDGGLVFTHIPAGTYALAENENHEIDTVVRKFKFTAAQIAGRWGRDAMSSTMRNAYDKPETRHTQEFEIWHLTIPRDIATPGNYSPGGIPLSGESMAWANIYIDPNGGEKRIIHESGYEEFPYLATRFIKYGNLVYGESALAPIVNTIEDYLEIDAALKEQAKACAFPRILTTAGLVEEINMRAGGMTVLRPEDEGSGYPREWAPATEYRIGKDLLEMYHQEIDDALFISVLQVVSQVDRQMTATEVQSRESEKLMTFTQTFTQFTADLRPLMNRIFCILARQGKFDLDRMPAELLRLISIDRSSGSIRLQITSPGIHYIGRLAKALERNKQDGLQSAIAFSTQMAASTQDPAWTDWLDPAAAMQFIIAEENVPVQCTRSLSECRTAQKRRDAALQMQMQIQAEQAQSQTTLNLANAQSK